MKQTIFSRFKPSSLKKTAVILSISAILASSLIGTVAWFTCTAQPLINTFQPATVTCSANESQCVSGSGGMTEKKNVSITNTGTMTAYIRVALVPSWKDGNGNIASPVAPTDYTLDTADKPADSWFHSGDYYYCKTPVNAGADSPVLIKSCKVNGAKSGLHFEMQVIASAIQYLPVSAVQEAWTGVTVTGGQLQKVGG